MVEITTARYAFQASLRAAMQSNAMMLQAINLGE
jgi:flagellar basal body rod protein FlgC